MELPKELTGRLYSERGAVVHSEINSERYRFKPEESQPKVLKSENDFLHHDSFVDCAQIFAIDVDVFLNNMSKGVFVPVGLLNEISMAFVLRAGQTCPMLNKVEQSYFK